MALFNDAGRAGVVGGLERMPDSDSLGATDATQDATRGLDSPNGDECYHQ